MKIIKPLVCLANSRRLQGRCVAGREIIGVERGGSVYLNSRALCDKWNHAAVLWVAAGAGNDLA